MNITLKSSLDAIKRLQKIDCSLDNSYFEIIENIPNKKLTGQS